LNTAPQEYKGRDNKEEEADEEGENEEEGDKE
jgi:hypothetical protein